MDDVLRQIWDGLHPLLATNLWWIVAVIVLAVVIRAPLPGRGPVSARRDPWRGFKYDLRRRALDRAGARCEAPVLLIWGRCAETATEVDHVYPWSRGGPTALGNGQALCRSHNRRKGALAPSWWYVLGLERRRRGYFPPGEDRRVLARLSDEERARRERQGTRRPRT
jgi:5-methylcytosine-specific restriction endonuclease McrA